MLYEQRAPRKEEEFAPTTRPWLHDADDPDRQRIAQSCAWWYVVVDELVGDWVKLVFAPWPTLDTMGRLTFSAMGKSIWLDSIEVRDRADRTRSLSRPLRISDVFAILASKGPSKVAAWNDIADITPDARESAKVAAFATRGDLLPPEAVEQLAATADPAAQQVQKAIQQAAAQSELPGYHSRTGDLMARVDALTASRLTADNFVASLQKDDLVYFLLNVGDADAQVVLLPEWNNRRRVIIVDAGVAKKVPALLDALVAAQLLATGPTEATQKSFPIALLVATHPHDDHIRGLSEILDAYPDQVAEFWESGYFHTAPSYHHMMAAVEKHTMLLHTQPTSGMQRWIGHTGLTVLSPSIHLRNRYDTYGVDINDSSISLRVEHPSSRVVQTAGSRNYQSNPNAATLILGGDAQTLSWSFALTDFPVLQPSTSDIAKFLQAAKGDWNMLRAAVLKVSHHASKRGVNLELVERIAPSLTLVSCDGMSHGKYGFPHDVAQEVLREAIEPRAGARVTKRRTADSDLNLFYTGQGVTGANAAPAGSIAVVMNGKRKTVWRFRDKRNQKIDFTNACRWK